MHEVKSLALFVGTGACNARCNHCAGLVHRKYAPRKDGAIDEKLITETLVDCYARGARSLSLSSSGEPTLSPVAVTKVLRITDDLRSAGMAYSPINLYSNGIRIGDDKSFSDAYLPSWRTLGLVNVYVTVHDVDEKKNAEVYGVKSYPSLNIVISRIHDADLRMRANLVLSRRTVDTLEKFVSMAEQLQSIDADAISAWPIRGIDDKIDDALAPPREELEKMRAWAVEHNVKLLSDEDHSVYDRGEKLTLFPDGVLSNTWCN